MGLLREDGHRTRSEDRDWDDETFFDAEDDAFTMFSSFAEEAAERGPALEHSDGYAARARGAHPRRRPRPRERRERLRRGAAHRLDGDERDGREGPRVRGEGRGGGEALLRVLLNATRAGTKIVALREMHGSVTRSTRIDRAKGRSATPTD